MYFSGEQDCMVNEAEQKAIIVASAAKLFARFGLEKTTMEDIAKAAKKGKSSLYYYFKSKEQVFAEVIKHEIAGLQKTILEAVEQENDPSGKLRKFVGTRLDYLSEKADQYTTVKEEYLKHYAFIQKLTEDYSQWELSVIKKIIQVGIAQGLFEVSDLDTTAKAIFFALKGLEYPWATNLTREEMQMGMVALVDILLKGINKG